MYTKINWKKIGGGLKNVLGKVPKSLTSLAVGLGAAGLISVAPWTAVFAKPIAITASGIFTWGIFDKVKREKEGKDPFQKEKDIVNKMKKERVER